MVLKQQTTKKSGNGVREERVVEPTRITTLVD